MRATRQHSNAGICKKQDKTLLALFWRQLISGRLKRWNVLTSLINTFRDYRRGDSFLSTVENSKLNVDFWKQLEKHFHGATWELPQCCPGESVYATQGSKFDFITFFCPLRAPGKHCEEISAAYNGIQGAPMYHVEQFFLGHHWNLPRFFAVSRSIPSSFPRYIKTCHPFSGVWSGLFKYRKYWKTPHPSL